MTVISEVPLCLKIHLSKYELKKYFNSYNEIDIENPNAKRTLSILFNIAVNTSTFEMSGKRLIEVFPTASGGCILKFTSNPLPCERNENNKNKFNQFFTYPFSYRITVALDLYVYLSYPGNPI